MIPLVPTQIMDIVSPEYWERKPPQEGDHIRVSRGVYNHHGIFVSNAEVIHFASHDDDNLLGTDNKVIRTTLRRFLREGKLEIKVYNDDELQDLYPVPEIIRWARTSIGDNGYNVAFNNCEHFANYCTLGRFHSRQVSNVLGGGGGMGILSAVGGFVGRIFGGGGSSERSSSSSSTVYEPDKVKVAEIERDKALKLAHAENDRIVLMKEAQIELMEFNAKMEAAIIEAKVRGFYALQQSLMGMMKEVNILGEERFVLLESASLDEVKKVEDLYVDLGNDIKNDSFMTEKAPQLFSLLKEFPEGSDIRQSYLKGIDLEIAAQIDFKKQQMSQLAIRCKAVMDSVIASKQQIHHHINDVVAQRITHMEQVLLTHQPTDNTAKLPLGSSAGLAITATPKLLAEKSTE